MTSVKLTIKNPRYPVKVASGEFLVDSGAHYSVIPYEMVKKLGLKPSFEQEFSLADAKIIKRKVGSAVIEFEKMELSVPIVLGEKGDEGLLGVTTLEAFGLMLNPFTRKLYKSKLMLALMNEDKKSSKLGLGILIGAIIGGLTTLFFSPKSGKQNRKEVAKKLNQLKKLLHDKELHKKVKEVFGEATAEATNIYVQAKEWLIEELAQIKEAIENIDKEKYEKAVNKVIGKVKIEVKKDVKEMEKLKKQLMKEWSKLKK